MKLTRRRILIASALLAAAALPCACIYLLKQIPAGIDDSYAQWGAAGMVIQYLHDHDGEWPPDWEALEPYFAESSRVGGWSFERFQSRVFIDFSADADALRAASLHSESVPFDVIHAHSFWAVEFGVNANEILHRHFRKEHPYHEAAMTERGSGETMSTDTQRIIHLLESGDIAAVATGHDQSIRITSKDGATFTGRYEQPQSGPYANDPRLSDILNLVIHIRDQRGPQAADWAIAAE